MPIIRNSKKCLKKGQDASNEKKTCKALNDSFDLHP